jgi:hypothetical protein
MPVSTVEIDHTNILAAEAVRDYWDKIAGPIAWEMAKFIDEHIDKTFVCVFSKSLLC